MSYARRKSLVVNKRSLSSDQKEKKEQPLGTMAS